MSEFADPPRHAIGASVAARVPMPGDELTLAVRARRAGVPLVELNLASDPQDPRPAQVRDAAAAAMDGLERTLGASPSMSH